MQQHSSDQPYNRELLVKYIAGESLPEEAMLVEDWIMASPENRRQYEELATAWNASAATTVSYEMPDIQREWAAFQQSIAQPPVRKLKRKKLYYYLAAACVLLLAIGFISALVHNKKTAGSADILVASAEAVLHNKLPDQTQFVLAANSTVTYNIEFDRQQRRIRLTGEGFFNVAHNAQKPFIIDLDGVSLQVVGTSFAVQNDSVNRNVKVEVVTGKVMLYNNTDTLLLKAGETGIYNRSSRVFERLGSININNFGYATQQFSFIDLPLQQVVQYLGKAYNVKTVFSNPAIAGCRLSAQFDRQSVDDIMEVIANTFGITWRMDGTTIFIDGKGCN